MVDFDDWNKQRVTWPERPSRKECDTSIVPPYESRWLLALDDLGKDRRHSSHLIAAVRRSSSGVRSAQLPSRGYEHRHTCSMADDARGFPEYPVLDRSAVHGDRELTRWEAALADAHQRAVATWAAVEHGPPDRQAATAERLHDFEFRARQDREWVSGYRAGLEDATRLAAGLKAKGHRAPDWDVPLARLEGYERGLAKGGTAE